MQPRALIMIKGHITSMYGQLHYLEYDELRTIVYGPKCDNL
jgi:hypothetical protein